MIDAAIARLIVRPVRTRVVPGHMGIQEWSALADARHYFARLSERVSIARTEFGAPLEDSAIGAIAIEYCMASGLIPDDLER